MSQAKVDRYKEEKKNRKKTMKKEKRNRVLARTLGVVIAAAVVCWIGFSGYQKIEESRPRASVTADYSAFEEYLNGLSGTEETE